MIDSVCSLIFKTEPSVKSNSVDLLGVKLGAEAISVPSRYTLTNLIFCPASQFPKSSLARPLPYKVVLIEPTE